MIKVSILIPCFNAEEWIQQTIESALNQTFKDKEVIVIDDGSTDSSWQLIQAYGSRIIAKRTANSGGGATRNLLLELSNYDWLQYLDADDYLQPDKLSEQLTILENNPDIDVLYSPEIFEIHTNGNVNTEIMPIPEPRDPWILLAKWRLPQTGASLWRKQAIKEVGGWKVDQPCCQEHELYLRLLKAGKQFYYSSHSGAVYRKWSEDTVCERDKQETYRQRLQITDAAEQFLQNTNQLTSLRQDEINQARFECARIIWNFDRNWSSSLMNKVQHTQSGFVPRGRGVPLFYRIIYSLFGFKITENIADFKRKVISCFSRSTLSSKNE